MSTKRYKGLPDNGIGKLLDWVPEDDPAFPASGYYKVSEVAKKDTTKVNVPKELVDFLRQQLIDDGGLKASQASSIPGNKVVLFYLFSSIKNSDWGDEFKKAYDSEREHPFQKIMDKDADRKLHDRYYQKSTRDIVMDIMDTVNLMSDGAKHQNAQRRREFKSLQALMYGNLRASAWEIARVGGVPPFLPKYYVKMGDSYPDAFVQNLNNDKLIEMTGLLRTMGVHDVNRLDQQKRKG